MSFKTCLLCAILLVGKCSLAQQYFDFYYTNIPEKVLNKYSRACSSATGWLNTGNYAEHPGCSNCYDYSNNSKLTQKQLDSLISIYKAIKPKDVYSRQYVPGNFYFVADKKNPQSYIIRTLYKIADNKAYPVFQVRYSFYDAPGRELPGIAALKVAAGVDMKTFDAATVLTSYKQKLEADKSETAPPIEKL